MIVTVFKTAIIVGATSGIGRALAELLISHGCRVGVTGRRRAYITRRWRLIAFLLQILPDFIYRKI